MCERIWKVDRSNWVLGVKTWWGRVIVEARNWMVDIVLVDLRRGVVKVDVWMCRCWWTEIVQSRSKRFHELGVLFEWEMVQNFTDRASR